MNILKRYLKIYGVQIKNNWVREAVYRTNFLTAIIVDLIWMFIELAYFSVIYANTETLAGWTKHQVFFFLGIFFASDAIFTTFFQRNFWTFSDLVNKGDLDILLTKPVNPVFMALTRWINLTAIFNFFMGISIAVIYADRAGFVGGWHWLLVVFWLFVGLVTQLLVRFAFSIWIFWTERSFALMRLYYQFFTFATKPDTIYPKAIRYVILTAIPFAFIGSIPTRALLFGLKPTEYLVVFVVLSSFLIFNITMWKKGIRRYQSVSS